MNQKQIQELMQQSVRWRITVGIKIGKKQILLINGKPKKYKSATPITHNTFLQLIKHGTIKPDKKLSSENYKTFSRTKTY